MIKKFRLVLLFRDFEMKFLHSIIYIFVNIFLKCIVFKLNVCILIIEKLSIRPPVLLQRLRYRLSNHHIQFGKPHYLENSNGQNTFIMLPAIGWNDMVQRQQQFAKTLSSMGWTVYYLTKDIGGDEVRGLKKIKDNLFLCSDIRILTKIENAWIYMWWPEHFDDLKRFLSPKFIYDYADNIEILTHYDRRLRNNHFEALKRADLVFATADSLKEDIEKIRPDSLLITNAVTIEDFLVLEKLPIPDDIADIVKSGKPIIAYYGIISEWKINYKLLLNVANKLNDFTFLLIGPDFDGSLNKFASKASSNIKILGKKHYHELPAYTRHFSLAMLPLNINKKTIPISPVKLFEYFAIGTPVVSTAIPECKKYKSVLIAENETEFVNNIKKAIQLKDSLEFQNILKTEAENNTWRKRCEIVSKNMQRINKQKLIK